MKRQHRSIGALSVALIVVALAALSIGDPSSGSASPGGLQNPGFEQGLTSWTATAVDTAVVVGTEGSAQCATYTDMGGVTVQPYKGSKSLRLGQCRNTSNSQQPKGPNKASQTFISGDSPLRFAFRLFAWEHRGYDEFSFDLKKGTLQNPGPSVGTLASTVTVPMAGAPGGQRRCLQGSTLPCKFTIDAGKSGQFVATDWIIVTVNIPVGETLTLTYNVAGGKDSGFASWAYWDNVNTPPVARFGVVNPQCSNDTDDDLDDRTNDGCPAVGAPELVNTQCADVNDDDGDGFINDGCPSLGAAAEGIFEGNVVEFTDTSFDVDGPQDIVAWLWQIDDATINAQNPIFIFPDEEGIHSACLTVTDSFGDSDTVCSGGIASDGTPISTLSIVNSEPFVNALNVEALAGQQASLFGRMLEPGWTDIVSADWQLDGQSPFAATVQQDNIAFVSSGVLAGTVPAAAAATGTLTVQDADGGASSDEFQLTIIDPNDPLSPLRHEPNDTLANPPVLLSDGSYLSWIQSVGDQDIFEVQLPDQATLPAGSELLVTLKGPGGSGLNADYDLVILAQLPGGTSLESGEAGQTAGWGSGGWGSGGWGSGGWGSGGWGSGGWGSGGWGSGEVRPGGWGSGGWGSGGWGSGGWGSGSGFYPLSQSGFNGLDGENIGSADITLEELGLGTLQVGGLSVAAYSSNLGTQEEAALARSDVTGTRFFVAVVGANGAFSNSQPYTLQIETSVPLDPATALGPEVCNKSPLVGPTEATSTVVDLNGASFPAAGDGKTLIVTQQERMIALSDEPSTPENEGATRWSALLTKLQALAEHPAVMADVISVPSVIFDSWDSSPCNVDEANAVAAAVRTEIQSRLTADQGLQYVVLAGDDDVIPQRRVPDETMIGNEGNYTLDAFLKPGSPLFSSLLGSFILTDDYYVDALPTPWQGRELYVPDRAIGRLTETPEEIGAAADAFLESNGLLDYSTATSATALVTGYDFFGDGANVTASNLATKLNTTTLINETWTADELRCRLLGQPSVGLTDCATPSVGAVNAHYTHYAGVSANGWNQDSYDFLNSNEVAAAGGATPALKRKVVLTMGCHGGFNVPDRAALPPDPGLGIDPSLDFVQAMARQQAVWIASTGYGLGDDQGLGGTELLLTYFSDEMVQGDDDPNTPPPVFIGNAFKEAKHLYLLSLSAMTPYDEKSSIQTTMFGLPQYQVLVPESAGSITPASAATDSAQTLTLTVEDEGAAGDPTTYLLEQHSTSETDDESYYSARLPTEENGDTQVTAFRPIQPRIVIPIASGNRVQGVLIKAGTYIDTTGFDPVISLPTQEWQLDDEEPDNCLDSFWPSLPVTINSIDPGGGGPQALVITPGQFRCTSGSSGPVTGIQRLYTSLTVELLHSDPSDTEPPTLEEVTLAPGATAGSLDVTVEASDLSGIASIMLYKYSGGTITPIPFAVPPIPGDPGFPTSGSFTVNVPSVGATDDIGGAIVDGADNVGYFTAKGSIGYTFLGVELRAVPPLAPDPVYVSPCSGPSPPCPRDTFQLHVPEFSALEAPFYTIDFGDGQSSSGPVTGVNTAIEHTYPVGTEFPTTARVRVMDAGGRLGSDTVTVRERCDPIEDAPHPDFDLVSCDVTVDTAAQTMTIAVRVVGQIRNEGQYRVNIQTATTNAQLKWDNGRATGPLSSLSITIPPGDPGELRFTFGLAEVGLASGGELRWSADAQTVGFADRMPDSGTKIFVVP